MSRDIDAEALYEDFQNDLLCLKFGSALKGTPRSDIDISNVLERIENAPTEDVTPVLHGYWIDNKHTDTVICSKCQKCFSYETPYCPKCGAKMDMDDP